MKSTTTESPTKAISRRLRQRTGPTNSHESCSTSPRLPPATECSNINKSFASMHASCDEHVQSDSSNESVRMSYQSTTMACCCSRAASSLLGGPHNFVTSPPIPTMPVRKASDILLDDTIYLRVEEPKRDGSRKGSYMHSIEPVDCRKRRPSNFESVPVEESDLDSLPFIDDDLNQAQPGNHADQSLLSRLQSIITIRSREDIVVHFLIELAMLRAEWVLIASGLLFQIFHSISTNVAYNMQTKLSAAQRIPLSDVFFDVLPELNGDWWVASEILVNLMIAIIAICIGPILVLRWHAPHKKPLYCITIIRRMLLVLCACQLLRIISFMVTTLPGSSRQCVYHVPENITAKEMLEGPAPSEGNPSRWSPPETLNEILLRVDATEGCGDLMFSSHTIFTMTFVCGVFKYFSWTLLKALVATLQILIVPLIIASHKHYSVDVFTALYVTPLVFELLWMKFPDKSDTSLDMAKHYNVRFYRLHSTSSEQNRPFIVGVWGREFYVDACDVPIDLMLNRETGTPPVTV